MKKIFLTLITFSFCLHSLAQLNKWLAREYRDNGQPPTIFGQVKMIDFTTNPPTVSTPSIGYGDGGEEDVNVMTDINNNILFTTAVKGNETIEVRDANFQIMQNGTGLFGHYSTFESGIVRVPCSNSKYYIFHINEPTTGKRNLYYSIIDLSNGGNVISKNNLLNTDNSEVLAISHQLENGCRWLITTRIAGNSFEIWRYLISASGIGSPLKLDDVNLSTPASVHAEIELSPSNTKLALATEENSTSNVIPDIVVWDFDLESGTISNRSEFIAPGTIPIISLEFSPDNSKIYFRNYKTPQVTGQAILARLDLVTGLIEIIDNSMNDWGSMIETAGNGKIYISQNALNGQFPDYLAEIANPNAQNISSIGYKRDAVLIGGGVRMGIPNAIDGEPPGTTTTPAYIDFEVELSSDPNAGCNTYIFLDKTCLATWWEWDFGDGTTSNLQNPTHQYLLNGIYSVTLKVIACVELLTLTKPGMIDAVDCCCNDIKVENGSYPAEIIFACEQDVVELSAECYDNLVSIPGMNYYWEVFYNSVSVYSVSNSLFQYTPSNPGYHTIVLIIGDGSTCESVNELTLFVSSCDPPECEDCIPSFSPFPGKTYIISAWVKELGLTNPITYDNPVIWVNDGAQITLLEPKGKIIDGWQKIEEEYLIPANMTAPLIIELRSHTTAEVLFDDVRIFPKNGSMKGFVYDPVTMRFVAELDENHYATFYEYDDEGKLIRVKKETERGVMTVQENRNNLQKQK